MRQLTIHLYCKSQLKSNLRNNTPCQCYFLYTNYVNDIKMCTLGSERISRPKRQIIERPDSSIPLPMMCTFFSVRSAHIFNSSLFNHITFKKFLGFFFREKIDKRKNYNSMSNNDTLVDCNMTYSKTWLKKKNNYVFGKFMLFLTLDNMQSLIGISHLDKIRILYNLKRSDVSNVFF